MTESEAIEMLKANLECQKKQVYGRYEECNSDKCDDCELCYKQGNNGERIESTKIAIQALEKQIQLKPLHAYDNTVDENWCSCPICYVGLGWEHGNAHKYCMNCGQKLDWGGSVE